MPGPQRTGTYDTEQWWWPSPDCSLRVRTPTPTAPVATYFVGAGHARPTFKEKQGVYSCPK